MKPQADTPQAIPWLYALQAESEHSEQSLATSETLTIPAAAEHFAVTEIFTPTPITSNDTAEHIYLWVEKIGENTAWVASALAEWFGVDERDIGYCGLKDRRGVTRQWFSVPHSAQRMASLAQTTPELPVNARILEIVPGQKKLRRGAHSGNQFEITLYAQERAELDNLVPKLEQIKETGVPNYFGQQRFGIDGNNLTEAAHWVASQQSTAELSNAQRNRNKRSRRGRAGRGSGHALAGRRGDAWHVSVARSALFNEVLAERVRRGDWRHRLPGDLDEASGPVPTGPLWGRGRSAVSSDTAAIESAILQAWPHWCHTLEHCGVNQERRPLVLRCADMTWQRKTPQTTTLCFSLPVGTFATAVLASLGSVRDLARG